MDSNWPLSLLLDEVWLKTRRVLTHKLESKDFWLRDEEYRQYIDKQKRLGNMIKSNVLLNVLGDIDYAYLNTELSFGPNNVILKNKIPYVMAFGYQIGTIMCELTCPKSTVVTISRISSVFNFGISLFDHICDSNPNLFLEFSKIINDRVLLEVINQRDACKELWSKCAVISKIELRLLTKVILWFFLELHNLYQNSKKTAIWEKLVFYVLSAYKAEIASSSPGSYQDQQLEIARSKSSFPFLIIYLICALRSYKTNYTSEIDMTNLSLSIGEIFWQIDDLRDILQDLELNYLNSILIRVNKNICLCNDIEKKYDVLKLLLNGSYIQSHVDRLCGTIEFVFDSIDSNMKEKKSENAKKIIMFYIRNWME